MSEDSDLLQRGCQEGKDKHLTELKREGDNQKEIKGR